MIRVLYKLNAPFEAADPLVRAGGEYNVENILFNSRKGKIRDYYYTRLTENNQKLIGKIYQNSRITENFLKLHIKKNFNLKLSKYQKEKLKLHVLYK